MEKFVLIDGTGLIYRGFYAIPPHFRTKAGVQTNAVFGFTSIILNIIENQKPTYMCIAFDLKGPTFRHKEYAEYKATRVKAPDELYMQISPCKEIIDAFDIPKFECEGFEADDIIATVVNEVKGLNSIETFIATGDFDLFQLVGPCVRILYPQKGFRSADVFDREAVKKKYGVFPEQISDYKALMGDSSDNIPGVRGIGPKNAQALIEKYDSIEELYEHLPDLSESIRTKLITSRENAFLSKKICTLDRLVPINFQLEKCKVKSFNAGRVLKQFEALEFRSLVGRLKNLYPEIEKASAQQQLF